MSSEFQIISCWCMRRGKSWLTFLSYMSCLTVDSMEKRVLWAFILRQRRRGRPRIGWNRTVKEVCGSMTQACRIADYGRFRSIVRKAMLWWGNENWLPMTTTTVLTPEIIGYVKKTFHHAQMEWHGTIGSVWVRQGCAELFRYSKGIFINGLETGYSLPRELESLNVE